MAFIPKIAHIILAAGASRRMKSTKQLLPWKHTTLLGWEIEKSLQLFSEATYVVLGANYELIAKEVSRYSVTIVNNHEWELGMGSTISLGLRHIINSNANYKSVLISLTDQPMIDQTHLLRLVELSSNYPEKIIATDMGGKFGVPAIFPSSFFDKLMLLQEDYGARYILDEYKEAVLSVEASGKDVDIDTIRQYEELKERERLAEL